MRLPLLTPRFLLLTAVAFSFLTSARAAELQIISRSPSGRTDSEGAARAITATFNQPMIPLNDPSVMGSFCPIRIEPEIPGRCRWMGTQTLSFEPSGTLPPARAFKVTVPRGTASKVNGAALPADAVWQFETLRPQIVTSKPTDQDRWIDLNLTLFAQFNLPMNAKRAGSLIILEEYSPAGTGRAETIALGVRLAKADEIKQVWPYAYYGIVPSTANVLALKPARALKKDHSYRLIFREGLPPGEGELGLLAERQILFDTYYTFQFIEPPAAECLPTYYRAAFSNPVKYEDFLAHLEVLPSTPIPKALPYQAKDTGSRDPHSKRVYQTLPDLAYKPDSTYQFTVKKGLEDIYGNKLSEDAHFTLETLGYCPRLDGAQGFGVLEAYLPPWHPLTAVNFYEIPVEMVRVADDQLIPFYQQVQWSPYVSAQKLDSPLRKTLKWNVPRNMRYEGYADMNEVLKGEGGFAFMQFQAPGFRGDQTRWIKSLDNVTRIGLTLKSSADTLLIWTTFLRTGAPAPHLPVEVRDESNRVLWQGKTNNQGIAKAPGWEKLGLQAPAYYQKPKLWVLAKDAKGTAAVSTQWQGGIEPWRFNLPYSWGNSREKYRGVMFSERGVYRPGEKVFVKGMLRKLQDGDWRSSDVSVLELRLKDSRGADVIKTTAVVSSQSSFHFEHLIKEEAPTGLWTLTASEPKERTSSVAAVRRRDAYEDSSDILIVESFRVEAFKPAAFEVRVVPRKAFYFAQETYQALIDGWYLFGAPMAEAGVEWTLRVSPGFYAPAGFEEFSFGGGWWEQPSHDASRILGSSTGKLDSQGKFPVDVKLEAGKTTQPSQVVLEASVTSPDRQKLFGRATVTVHPANVYLGLKPQKFFTEAGQDWGVDIVTLFPDGNSAAGIPVTTQLIHREWMSVQRSGLAGRLEWISEQKDTVISTGSFVSDASTRTWTQRIEKPGQYILKVSAQDQERRAAESSISMYATGPGMSWWQRGDTDIIDVVPDKKSYKPGDTARLLIKSPYPSSRVLVTLEREGVIDHWIANVDGTSNMISIPLKEAHVPNVYVGVMLVQGRSGTEKFSDVGDDLAKPQVKFGYVNLAVDPGGRRLAVRVKSDKAAYRPRERVSVLLQTFDEKGAAAPAEVTVYAVDEGVLSLTGYATPDPFAAFYGPRPLRVDTADTRLHLIGQRNFGEKGENRGGGGGSGAALEGIDLRTKFVPTPYWNPGIMTDARGQAQVSFTLPDNLSRFRIMAVASAKERFGSGDAKITVSKPLLMRPSLPRFARVGDTFQGGVVLHNYSASAIKATLQLQTSGTSLKIEGASQRDIRVEAGKAQEVLWSCKAVGIGQSALKFRVAAGQETDGLEWKVPVKPAERLKVVATSGVTERNAVEVIEKPDDILVELGGLSATLSPSALAGLQESARYLLEYPYGCLEQRLSRALPVIVGADLIATFKLGTVGQLKSEVQKQLDRLGDFQHAGGGFGYWPNPWLPDPYITAYALEVAHLAGKEGYKLPDAVLTKATAWLKSSLAGRQEWAYPYSQYEDYCARAYALYVLGLRDQAPSNYFTQLYQRRDQIPYCGKAYLFKAAPLVMRDNPAMLQTLSDEMLNQARMAPTSLHFEEPSETRMPWIHESTVLTTARILQAFLEAKGGFPGDEKAVKWLIDERKNKGSWRTTLENASTLRALQDYYRRYEKAIPQFTATLARQTSGHPQTLWQENFSGRTLNSRQKTWTMTEFFGSGDKVKLSLDKQGTGRLYYTLRLRYAPVRMKKPAQEGLEITKAVTPLYGSKGHLRAGSRAVVTLTVKTPQDRTFVAIEDPLPGGYEIVDPTFAVEGQEDARAMEEESARGPYWGTFGHQEKYDDRILIFADFLTAGEHTYRYLVQATTPGDFSAPATFIEQMYEPEVFGHTASDRVEIRQ